MRRGLLVFLLAAAARAEEADFSLEALKKRVEILRPDIEAALGAPLGDPVEVVVSTPDALKELLAAEFVAQRSEIAGGPRGEDLLKACRQDAELVSQFLLAKVELERGAVHVCPDNFRRIAELDPAWKGLVAQDALDSVLLHEMVHVFQVRRLGLKRFLAARPTLEDLQARSAVLEGHAQHVGRKAAKARGLVAAAGLIDKAQTEVPASVEDPAMRHISEVMSARMAFAYVDGEKFIAALVGKLGYEKAIERAFSSPPATLRAVSRPDEYLEPPAEDGWLDDFAGRLQRLISERGYEAVTVPLPIPALRAAFAPAGPKVAEEAMRAFEKGIAVMGPGKPQVTIGLLLAKDDAAGRVLYDSNVATSKAKDGLFGKPGSEIRIVAAEYSPFPADAGEGIAVDKTVETLAVPQRVESVIVLRGALVLEVMVVNTGPARGRAAALAREVLELLRGKDAADAWDGKKGDEARRALLGALDDPHWGARWRAVGNLARMKESAETDAALSRMLRDGDTAVRCAAFRALARRGWLGRAPAAERDALAAHPDWEVRLAFQRAVAEQGKDKEAQVARLLSALEDPHPAVRAYAFEKLDDLDAEIPWERVRAGIEDPDGDVRLEAIGALGFADLDAGARDVLLKALRDDHPLVRFGAAMRLDRWVKESPAVLDALIEALKDGSPIVRDTAARALGEAGKAAAAAVPALVGLLDDEFVRKEAAKALGEIGIAEPEALGKLETHVKNKDLDLRFEVARALWRLGRDPSDLAPVFAETLRRGEDHQRGDAAEALGELGELARPYVGDLIAALSHKEGYVRADAARALGRLGAVAKDALPELEKRKDGEEGYAVNPAISQIRAAIAAEERR